MSPPLRVAAFVGLLLSTGPLVTGAMHEPILFTDVTTLAGIDFVHITGATGQKFMVETMGAGAVFFDYDGDLDPDLYLVNGGLLRGFAASSPISSALYRNDGWDVHGCDCRLGSLP